MNSLNGLLRSRPGDSPAIYDSRGVVSSAGLLDAANTLRAGILAPLRGQAVSVQCGHTMAYINALAALDGLAGRMLLIEDTVELSMRERFEGLAGISWRITARQDGIQAEQIAPECAGNGGTEWVIPTSGTTGEPKLIAHTFQSLARTVKPPSSTSAGLRWGLLYSPTRFAGLQVILQALGGGSGLIVPDSISGLDNAVPLLARHSCNALSATPSLWRKLAFSGLLDSLNLAVVTLGGETADQKILDELRRHFPFATIRHIYASTEAGVGFSVSDGQAGFPRSYLNDPPPWVELLLDEDGILMLRPRDANQRLLSDSGSLSDKKGWISSGDLVELRGDRCHFLGRSNGMINVGGVKVHPSQVEETLLEVEGIVSARAYAKANPVLGSLVIADIVIAPEYEETDIRRKVNDHCRQHLERHQTPAMLNFVISHGLTPAGKIKR